jgi:hypothetical protein
LVTVTGPVPRIISARAIGSTETTPSSSTCSLLSAIALRICAASGKSGVKLASRASVAIVDPYCSSVSRGNLTTGPENPLMSLAEPCHPIDTLPSSACRIASEPGRPPVARSSAGFWITSR